MVDILENTFSSNIFKTNLCREAIGKLILKTKRMLRRSNFRFQKFRKIELSQIQTLKFISSVIQ